MGSDAELGGAFALPLAARVAIARYRVSGSWQQTLSPTDSSQACRSRGIFAICVRLRVRCWVSLCIMFFGNFLELSRSRREIITVRDARFTAIQLHSRTSALFTPRAPRTGRGATSPDAPTSHCRAAPLRCTRRPCTAARCPGSGTVGRRPVRAPRYRS